MKNRESALIAKVKAVNTAHSEAMKLYDTLREVFAPLIGHKILKNDGGLLKSVKVPTTLSPSNREVRITRHTSNYSLAWDVCVCVTVDEHSCLYHTITVYVGDLNGVYLKTLYQRPVYRTDYTGEEIQKKRETLEAAQKAFDNARSDLYPFTEEDR